MLLLLISRRFGADQSPLLLYCCCCSVAAVELLLLQRSCLAELPKYVRKQEVALELCLDPDESSPYFIIPSIEKPDTEGSFTITVFVPVCLGICFCVSRYLSLCVSVFASVCLGICPCVSRYLPLCVSVFAPVCLGICPCVSQYLPLCVSVFAPVCLGICPCLPRTVCSNPARISQLFIHHQTILFWSFSTALIVASQLR